MNEFSFNDESCGTDNFIGTFVNYDRIVVGSLAGFHEIEATFEIRRCHITNRCELLQQVNKPSLKVI